MSNSYRGIVLAGGSGSRLFPITKSVSKQLLPIYDKPLIYYSLSVLMLAGISEILIISSSEHLASYKRLLGDGSQFGVKLSYKIQLSPDGVAQAFILGDEFIGNKNVALILGDNFFYGQDLLNVVGNAINSGAAATIFGYRVKNPADFGVIELDGDGNAMSIEEKPVTPKSSYAVTGLYLYDNDVVGIAKTILPSSRGELEITDVNNMYRERGTLKVKILGRGVAWLDAGTPDGLLEAGQFVQTIEKRQGLKVACLEEIGFRNGWLALDDLTIQAQKLCHTGYGEYLNNVVNEYKIRG